MSNQAMLYAIPVVSSLTIASECTMLRFLKSQPCPSADVKGPRMLMHRHERLFERTSKQMPGHRIGYRGYLLLLLTNISYHGYRHSRLAYKAWHFLLFRSLLPANLCIDVLYEIISLVDGSVMHNVELCRHFPVLKVAF